VEHEAVACRAVPVVLAWFEVDAVAGADGLDAAAFALAEANALGEVDGLAVRMGVLGGPGAGREVHERGGEGGRGLGRDHRERSGSHRAAVVDQAVEVLATPFVTEDRLEGAV
jgi:hypothetical protein